MIHTSGFEHKLEGTTKVHNVKSLKCLNEKLNCCVKLSIPVKEKKSKSMNKRNRKQWRINNKPKIDREHRASTILGGRLHTIQSTTQVCMHCMMMTMASIDLCDGYETRCWLNLIGLLDGYRADYTWWRL